MKRNEEMVTAGCLWCSCWRTLSGGVSVTKCLVMLVQLQEEAPGELGTAGWVVAGSHLWWGSRILRSKLWDPPDSGFLLPTVQGERFPQLLSQLCQCCRNHGGVGRSGVRVDQGKEGDSYWRKEMLSLMRMSRMVRSRDRNQGVWSVWGKGTLVRAQSPFWL